MVDRLELLLKTKGLSPAQLADEIQVQRSGIYHIMKGRNKPGLDFITKLLDHFPEINSEWLIMGKGPMIKKSGLPLMEEPAITNPTKPSYAEKGSAKKEITTSLSKTNSGKESSRQKDEKTIEKIVVFYNDKTFSEYYPQ